MKKKDTKKKKKETPRISPPVPKGVIGVLYEEIKDGDAFIYEGHLWMKWDTDDQRAYTLDGSGVWDCGLCGNPVIPVDIKITWKEIK